MEQFVVNLDSQEYKAALRDARKKIRIEIEKGTNPHDLELIREPGESNSKYFAFVCALKEAQASLKKQQEKVTVRKREPIAVGEVREYYGKKCTCR